MTRCPKCKYIRTPEDAGIPGWQCPSCGVAYAKFEDAPLGVKSKKGYDPQTTYHENLQKTSGGLGTGTIALVAFVFIAILVYVVTKPSAEQIRDTVTTISNGTNDVVLYSTQRCGYCRQARTLLAHHKVDYVEKDVEASLTAQQEFRALNGRGVPVLVIGEEVLHGYSQPRITTALKKAGKLE